MELFEIQNMIKRKEKPKLLVFVGSDYAIANIYIDNISKFFNLEKYPLNDLSNFIPLCRGDAIFSSNRIFILKYSKDLSSCEKIFENIDEIIGDNVLVVVLNEVDKRTKFYTQNKEFIVECNPQEFKTFKEMVAPSTKLTPEHIKELGEICGYNYGKFLLELDKVKQLSSSNNISEDEALQKLISTGVIYTGNRDVIFQFIDKVLTANNKMYELYNILKLQQESNIKLISLLYTAFRSQFIVETVVSPTTDSTGLAPFIIGQCQRRKGIYSQADLRYALKLLLKLEQGVKSGIFEESQIIDHFLSELIL
ncbi:MAG: hypothetical protein RR342_01495 [Bacilli bacterium]|jgi:DNA polymerase III delta subunit